MEETLDALSQAPGIQGAMIVGKDGLVIAQSGNLGAESDLMGATTAELFSNAESALGERLSRGALSTVTLEAGSGSVFLRNLDDVTFLLVLGEERMNLGLVRYEIRRAAERLRELL